MNVARLVRWLRAAGIDTAWEDAISDKDLVRRAIRENRYVLTLDKRLKVEWRADNVLLLESDKALEQFEQIIEHFNLKFPAKLFTLCLVCNTVLRDASSEEIETDVPLRVRETQDAFYYCQKCQRIYWEGSHTLRMRGVIEGIYKRRNQ